MEREHLLRLTKPPVHSLQLQRAHRRFFQFLLTCPCTTISALHDHFPENRDAANNWSRYFLDRPCASSQTLTEFTQKLSSMPISTFLLKYFCSSGQKPWRSSLTSKSKTSKYENCHSRLCIFFSNL